MAENELREMIRSEFAHVGRRLDDMCDLALERHMTVVKAIDEVKDDVKTVKAETSENTNTIGKQGRDIRALFSRSGGEQNRLMFYGTLVVAGGTGIVWFLRMVGVLK